MHRASVFYFSALLLLALVAFWPSYIVPPRHEADWHVHLHGVAMFLWMLLLIAQAALIRAGALAVHRRLGKASYGLVPVIVASTVLLAHYRLRAGITPDLLYFLYVQASLIAVFLVAYVLAMANRRAPQRHMRYMVCVALTLVDPILARVLYNGLGIVPPLMQAATYAVVDLVLIALVVNDWRRQAKARVYPAMLALFVASQLPTFFVHGTSGWRRLAEAFAGLPLP